MKKIVLSLIMVLLLLGISTGCKNSNIEDKEVKINKELNNKIEETSIFEGLDILNDNTLETQLGINRNFVESHSVGISMYGNTKKLYMIIKPKEENKKIVKQALDLYIERKTEEALEEDKKLYENVLKEEYNGYYVYIVSDNNEEVFNKITEYLK